MFACNQTLTSGVVLEQVCMLACGVNLYDSQFGPGSCTVVATPAACPAVFGAGGRYAGYCDFTCGYCDPPASTLQLATAPEIPACPEVLDELELSHGAGTCKAISRRRDCHFADTPSPYLLKRLLKGEGGAAK